MRIVVNDIAASEGGAITVLKEFYQEIIDTNDTNEWFFFLSDDYLEERHNIHIMKFPKIKKSWLKRLLFDLFYGKKVINDLSPDVYLSLQNSATIGVEAVQIVYLHQSLPYQTEKDFSFFKKTEVKYAIYQKIIGRIYSLLFNKSRSRIIVQTQWIKKAIQEKLSNQIVVIPPKIKVIEKNFDLECLNKDKKISFFYPASEFVYKNHEIIYEAVDILLKEGYSNFVVNLTIDPKEKYNNTVYNYLGKISRELVFNYYESSVLLFPSYIETYGLPLKEAKMINSPIIASDTAFAREVLEGYENCLFFNKNKSSELANAMKDYLNRKVKHHSKSVTRDDNYNLSILNFITNIGDKNDK